MFDLKMDRQTLRQSPKVVVVSLAGEVEASNGLQVEQYVDRVLQEEQPRHILLDLGGLTFAGSVFFSALLFWRDRLTRQGGQLVLYGLRPEIVRTMRILALDRVLTIRADQPCALDALSGRE
jgi:stage II sporulation protein AA (anti-sigma F factor antagonist)